MRERGKGRNKRRNRKKKEARRKKRPHKMMRLGGLCADLVINFQISGTYNPGTSKSEKFQIWVTLDHFSAALFFGSVCLFYATHPISHNSAP